MNSIEIMINSHCDLKCMYCHRHSNISSSDIYLPEQVHADLLHLKQLGHTFNNVRITGGEPFINPHLWDYISMLHQFGIRNIDIATNGKYLSKCDDYVFEKLKNANVALIISLYPEPSIDYDKLINKLREYHIKLFRRTVTYGKHYGDDKRRYLMLKMRLSESPKELTSERCFQRMHNCALLHQGYFYKCGVMCNLRHVDTKFGTNFNDLLIENEDYINIRTLTEFNPIIDAYTSIRPVMSILPFCKYCSAGYNHGIKGEFATWNKSKGDRIEFIEV